MRVNQKCRKTEQLCLLTVVSGLFFLSSCKPVETTAANSSTPPPPGVVDDSKGFQVWTLNSPYMIHSDGKTSRGLHTYRNGMSWANPATCVAKDGEDVLCYIEAPELDLWFTGASIQYNVPTHMCEYLNVELPWYYAQPAGIGGSLVSYSIDNRTSAVVPGTVTDIANSARGTPYCPFNYTSQGGPNCCSGQYTLSVTTASTVTTGSTTSDSYSSTNSTASWGGSVSNCVAGAATKAKTETGLSLPLSQWAVVRDTGLAGVINVPSPMSLGLNGNTAIANYFDIATTTNYDGLSLSDYPPAIAQKANPLLNSPRSLPIPNAAPSVTATPTPLYATDLIVSPTVANPFYSFTCYNHYQEVSARIRVMVRSWDVESKIGTATDYVPNYTTETGVGGSAPIHDRMTMGDLFFNYYINTGASLVQKSWVNTTSVATCTNTRYVPGTTYVSPSIPCVGGSGGTNMTAMDGFPGWGGDGVPPAPPTIIGMTAASSYVSSMPTSVVATFSKPVLSLSGSDFAISGDCATPPTATVTMNSTNTAATATLAGAVCAEGKKVVVGLDPQSLTDLVGTSGIGTVVSRTYILDSTGPVPAFSANSATITHGTTQTAVITLSYTDAGVGGISLTTVLGTGIVGATGQGLVITAGGTGCTVTVAKDAATATATLTVGSCTVAGTLTIDVAAGVAKDSLNNSSSASAGPAVTITVN